LLEHTYLKRVCSNTRLGDEPAQKAEDDRMLIADKRGGGRQAEVVYINHAYLHPVGGDESCEEVCYETDELRSKSCVQSLCDEIWIAATHLHDTDTAGVKHECTPSMIKEMAEFM
jgi:hypothetical protein